MDGTCQICPEVGKIPSKDQKSCEQCPLGRTTAAAAGPGRRRGHSCSGCICQPAPFHISFESRTCNERE
jgi:hypothetical protein